MRAQKFKSAICLRQTFGLEGKYRELFETFLHYHLAMGFEHIYIYDHDGTADTDLVRELVILDKVTYTYAIDNITSSYRMLVGAQLRNSGAACQAIELNHCLIQNRIESDFLFFVKGFDKFITSEHGPDTLTKFLEKYHHRRDEIGVIQSGAQRVIMSETQSPPQEGINFDGAKPHLDGDPMSESQELPIFLRQRALLEEYDTWWFPITTAHVHSVGDTGARPRQGYAGDIVLTADEFRANHYYHAFGDSSARSWRLHENETNLGVKDESEGWMGWGYEWVQQCRARSRVCPYLKKKFDT